MLRVLVPLAAILAMPGAEAPLKVQPAAKPAQTRPAEHAHAADPLAAAPRISAADARKAVQDGKAVIVDVRAEAAYAKEHAKGALNIPVQEISARAGELPRNKQIIAYCT